MACIDILCFGICKAKLRPFHLAGFSLDLYVTDLKFEGPSSYGKPIFHVVVLLGLIARSSPFSTGIMDPYSPFALLRLQSHTNHSRAATNLCQVNDL